MLIELDVLALARESVVEIEILEGHLLNDDIKLPEKVRKKFLKELITEEKKLEVLAKVLELTPIQLRDKLSK